MNKFKNGQKSYQTNSAWRKYIAKKSDLAPAQFDGWWGQKHWYTKFHRFPGLQKFMAIAICKAPRILRYQAIPKRSLKVAEIVNLG